MLNITEHYLNKLTFKILSLAITILFISACNDSETNQSKHKHTHQIIQAGEECHLCGMAITQFPGPKGQAFSKHHQQIKNFCSTNDLFAYILQPENKHNIAQAFVHDMSGKHWDKPEDSNMIDARNAWYVKGHKLRGAMGPILASFSSKEQAEFFIKLNGGEVLSFDQITPEILTGMSTHHH